MAIAPMAALKVEEWDRMIDVNLKGLLYGVAAVLTNRARDRLRHRATGRGEIDEVVIRPTAQDF